jgi:hypothetical protein
MRPITIVIVRVIALPTQVDQYADCVGNHQLSAAVIMPSPGHVDFEYAKHTSVQKVALA